MILLLRVPLAADTHIRLPEVHIRRLRVCVSASRPRRARLLLVILRARRVLGLLGLILLLVVPLRAYFQPRGTFV